MNYRHRVFAYKTYMCASLCTYIYIIIFSSLLLSLMEKLTFLFFYILAAGSNRSHIYGVSPRQRRILPGPAQISNSFI